MTCEECIHKSVCYRVDSVRSDYARKCGDFESGCKALEQEPKWIPLTTRPMTEEEQQYYAEHWAFTDSGFLDDDDKPQIFDCPLPEDGQDVLITVYGYVDIDTFIEDVDGCYFEGMDISDVTAWMPLPKKFQN